MIMKTQHVGQMLLCCMWMYLFGISSTLTIGSNQTTNHEDCNLLNCPQKQCTSVYFSAENSSCIFNNCVNDTLPCDQFVVELGRRDERKLVEKYQKAINSPPLSAEDPVSPSVTAPATPTAPLSHSVSLPDSETRHHSATGIFSDSGFTNTDIRPSQGGGQGQVQNLGKEVNSSLADAVQMPITNSSLTDGDYGQFQNDSYHNNHHVQPSSKPSMSAPNSPSVLVSPEEPENISSGSNIFNSQNVAQVTGSSHEPNNTNATTFVKPTLLARLTAASINMTTVTVTTTGATITSITNKVTSPPSTSQIPSKTTPSPTAPTFFPSVTSSTSPSLQNHSTTTPTSPDVTSDQHRAIMKTAKGAFHVFSSSSLIAVLIFGLLFFLVTIILFLRHAYESYKRRGYTQMDYLINGMYSDSGL